METQAYSNVPVTLTGPAEVNLTLLNSSSLLCNRRFHFSSVSAFMSLRSG